MRHIVRWVAVAVRGKVGRSRIVGSVEFKAGESIGHPPDLIKANDTFKRLELPCRRHPQQVLQRSIPANREPTELLMLGRRNLQEAGKPSDFQRVLMLAGLWGRKTSDSARELLTANHRSR